MDIDRDRIRAILKDDHSYYGKGERPIRRDDRWKPTWNDLIVPQLQQDMKVLEVGCGNGEFLFEVSEKFHSGLGIDYDPEHIQLAKEAKRTRGNRNVDFLLLDYPRETARLQPESFDMVVSMRGPLTETTEGIQAAHRLLRPDGLIFCEEIAEDHQWEVAEIFGDLPHNRKPVRKVDEVKAKLENSGFEVRLAADVFTKWIYPDVYAWLQFMCDIWTWLGIALPKPDDPRITQFAERFTIGTGEISTTHHVALVGGVKLE